MQRRAEYSTKRRLAICNRVKAPSYMALLDELVIGDSSRTKPVLCIACGDVARPDIWKTINPILTWSARPHVALAIAEQWSKRNTSITADYTIAKAIGELSATHTVRDKDGEVDVLSARSQVHSILQATPVPRQALTQVVNSIIRVCKDVPRCMIPNPSDGARHIFDWSSIVPVSQQTFEFHVANGQAIPIAFFLNEESKQSWSNLCNPAIHHVDLNDFDISFVPNLAEIWTTLGMNAIFALYDAIGYQNTEVTKNFYAAATVTTLASLCKESNLTQGWLGRRKEMIMKTFRDCNIDEYCTIGTITAYSNVYSRDVLSSDELCTQLIALWSGFKEQNLTPLMWMIEQASSSNITSAISFANAVRKLAHFDIDWLLSAGIPSTQAEALLTLAMHVLHNPYCSIIAPPITIAKYPDLGYIGVYMLVRCMRDQSMSSYAGRPDTTSALSRDTLENLAKSVYDLATTIGGRDLTVQQIYSTLRQAQDMQVIVSGDFVAELPLSRGGVIGQSEPTPDDTRGSLGALRADWPTRLRNLPNNARRISPEEMINKIKDAMSERSKAFNVVLSALAQAAIQQPLELIPDSATTIPSLKRALNQNIINALTLWNIAIPQEFTNVTPDIAGVSLTSAEIETISKTKDPYPCYHPHYSQRDRESSPLSPSDTPFHETSSSPPPRDYGHGSRDDSV